MNIRKIIALLLAVAMMLALVSCVTESEEDGDPKLDGKIDYKVTVVDPFGTPVPQMIVSIYNGETEVEMRLTDKDGIATPKSALTGDSFTVKVSSPKGDKLCYDESACILKDGKEEITVVLYQSTEDLYVEDLYLRTSESGDPEEAPVLTSGGYMVDLIEGDNYFVFTPSSRGVYTISATSSATVSVGYYGSPHFVQDMNLASDDGSGEVYMSNGSVCFNIRGFNVGDGYGASSRYVIMIESSADAKGFITIGYSDELSMSLQELPWSEYILPAAPEAYVVPNKDAEGFALTDVDITSKTLTIVYNTADELYHVGSENGPVVLLRMTSASKYLPSFESIMESDPFAVYVYDDNGEFVDKVMYQNMMLQYCEAADPDYGVVPLDRHLLEAITNYGKSATHSWFGGANASPIFGEDQASVNRALEVYFACCYYAG